MKKVIGLLILCLCMFFCASCANLTPEATTDPQNIGTENESNSESGSPLSFEEQVELCYGSDFRIIKTLQGKEHNDPIHSVALCYNLNDGTSSTFVVLGVGATGMGAATVCAGCNAHFLPDEPFYLDGNTICASFYCGSDQKIHDIKMVFSQRLTNGVLCPVFTNHESIRE